MTYPSATSDGVVSGAPPRATSGAPPRATSGVRRPRTAGLRFAWAAAAVGLLFAGISLYWGFGGTWLLDTVGGQLAAGGRSGSAMVVGALWAAIVLKCVAVALPLLTFRSFGRRLVDRTVLALAVVEAFILTAYGLVLTAVGLLVQAGIITATADTAAEHRALAWHAYLWDPWFLLWGGLVVGAMLRHRAAQRRRTPLPSDTNDRIAR